METTPSFKLDKQDFKFPEDFTDHTHVVLRPLYGFTEFFLGSILQQTTITYLTDALGTDIFSDPNEFVDKLISNWQTVALYWLGYVILAAFGLVFVIVFPITGLCVCCCRCRGKCGGKSSRGETKNSKCARVTCGMFLFVFALIVFIGCVCAFLSSVHLWDQTKADDGALQNAQQSFEQLDEYVNDTVVETDDLITSALEEAKDDIFNTLDNVGPHTRDLLGNLTNVGPLLDTLVEFSDNLTSVQLSLYAADNSTTALQAEGSQLQADLTTLQSDIFDDVSLCSGISTECADIAAIISDLEMGVDYIHLADLSIALLAVDYVVEDDIQGQVMAGWAEFESIADSINQTWMEEVTKAKDEINQADDEVQDFVNQVSEQLAGLNTSVITSSIEDIKPLVDEYGAIAFYTLCGLTCVSMVVVFLVCTGLLCGACCKRPHPTQNKTCTTRIAANSLLAATGFVFIFAWLLMVLITAMFLTGGLAYTEVCRHLVDPSQSEVIEVIDDVVSNAFDANISVAEFLDNCHNDEAIYTALDIDSTGFNISEVLDINNYNIQGLVDDIKGIDVSIGNITILSEAAIETLNILDTGISSINFTQNYIILNQNVTKLDLVDLAQDLEAAADSLILGGLADQLRTHASALRALQNTTVAQINTNRQLLRASCQDVEEVSQSTPIDDLISGLTEAQVSLNANSSALISGAINSTADSIYSTLEGLLSSLDAAIRADLGRCLRVYQAVSDLVDVGCKDVLSPYNGFWISQGWMLICFIPMTAMCFYMAGLYRATHRFGSVEQSSSGEHLGQAQDGGLKTPAPEGEEMVQVTEHLENTKELSGETPV